MLFEAEKEKAQDKVAAAVAGENRKASAPVNRDSIFVCYSQKNMDIHDAVAEMLKGLGHQAPIQSWSDQALEGGQRWQQEIDQAIERTKVAILLVSRKFMASDFIQEYELPRFLELEQAEKLEIIPVFIEEVPAAESVKAFTSPAPNSPNRPLKGMRATTKDKVLCTLGERVRAIFEADGAGG